METEKKNSFLGWPDLWLLNEFIDLESWDNHNPNALDRRKYPLAYVDLVSEDWGEEEDGDYHAYEYEMTIHIPVTKLDVLTEVMEVNGWEVDTDDSDVIDGWYKDVRLSKEVWKECADAN